jgi:hypothetical protein
MVLKDKIYWKRLVIVCAILIISWGFIYFGYDYNAVFKELSVLINSPKRQQGVWAFCFIFCGAHYFCVTRKQPDRFDFIIRTSNSFQNFVLTFSTLAIVINSCLSVTSGLINEFTGTSKFFINVNALDYFSISAGVLFNLIWAFVELVKIVESTFKRGENNTSEVLPLPDENVKQN